MADTAAPETSTPEPLGVPSSRNHDRADRPVRTGSARRAIRRRRGRTALVVLAGVAIGLITLQQLALRDLRRLEAAYIAGRQPTACATQALAPGAFSTDQSRLPQTVFALVTHARAETVLLQRRYAAKDHVGVPLPSLRSADRSIGRALNAQVALYDAMVDDPTHSEPKLHVLGLANTAAEHRLARARGELMASQTMSWKRRFVCNHR